MQESADMHSWVNNLKLEIWEQKPRAFTWWNKLIFLSRINHDRTLFYAYCLENGKSKERSMKGIYIITHICERLRRILDLIGCRHTLYIISHGRQPRRSTTKVDFMYLHFNALKSHTENPLICALEVHVASMKSVI